MFTSSLIVPPPTPVGLLQKLQSKLRQEGVSAYWVPSVDEHLNEYLPDARKRREWLTGFDGSAGDLLVTQTHAYLLVDSRYHEQVDLQVNASQVTAVKLGLEGQASSVSDLLKKLVSRHFIEVPPSSVEDTIPFFTLGMDPTLTSIETKNRLLTALREAHQSCGYLVEESQVCSYTSPHWVDTLYFPQHTTSPLRLTPPESIIPLPHAWTGRTLQETLTKLQEAMKAQQEGLMILTKLDQIAWLTQLRGKDIPYNPVFHAYMMITPTHASLFIQSDGLTPEARTHLAGCPHLVIEPYETFFPKLKLEQEALAGDLKVVWVPSQYPVSVERLLAYREKSSYTHHPIDTLKGTKNTAELQAMRRANLLASHAKHGFIQQLKQDLASGVRHTEASAAALLSQRYEALPEFYSLSFNSIAGYQHHGAIVHYGTPSADTFLTGTGLFLVDSGCQVAGGTTDKTRTIAIGTPTPKMKHAYTSVLKAHIRGAMQRFPVGTTGVAIDAIVRSALWQQGLNYGHGTGHGVGAFLNVHEGTHGIHARTQVVLAPGMVMSIEPGYYESGWGGIRLENLYEVVACSALPSPEYRTAGTHGGWLKFESLTWVPFEEALIEWGLLSLEERTWLEGYQHQCSQKLEALSY
ncbi:MAG: M24 family metallopeptidase [Vampirovibrionales bacterium]